MYKEKSIYKLPSDIKLKIFDFIFFNNCPICDKFYIQGYYYCCSKYCYICYMTVFYKQKIRLLYLYSIVKFQILIDFIINIIFISGNIYLFYIVCNFIQNIYDFFFNFDRLIYACEIYP